MTSDRQTLLRAAMAAVRKCADTMEAQAERLRLGLPEVATNEELRATALELSAGLKDTSGRVNFELALLQTELGEGKAEAATAMRSLARMEATMMGALDGVADLVDRLEGAAEQDEHYEPAFVLVIEAAGVMLQSFENARAATQALGAAMPAAEGT